MLVTVDGPAASGKTSVCREVARRLGWKWVSTGAFYRGLAYLALKRGVSVSDEDALAKLIDSSAFEVRMEPLVTAVYIGESDVTKELASEDVGSAASQVSQWPKVRSALLQAQRNCYTKSVSLIAEGRDCGTVVFPDADLKFFLTASKEDRAQRRSEELGKNLSTTLKQQHQRDQRDEKRAVSPLLPAPDAHVINTSPLSLEQVIDQVFFEISALINKAKSL